MEEVGMLQVFSAGMLSHRGDHAQGREGAEQGGLQDVGLLVGVNPKVVQRVVPALEHAVRLLHHGVDPLMQCGAQVCRALAVPVLLRRLDRIALQLPALVRGQLVRGGPDVCQKVLNLRQHGEGPIGLLDASGTDLPTRDVLVHDDPRVEAEGVLNRGSQVLLPLHERDASGVVLVAWLHHQRHANRGGPLLLTLHQQVPLRDAHPAGIQQLLRGGLVRRRPHGVLVVPEEGDV
mmetsp:Transcript_74276/g.187784  ORF Transcript_74276/g.187784 Transcript_74276/m.187784 type:complete len:234 (+) Transcript_74276:638-1339(+)